MKCRMCDKIIITCVTTFITSIYLHIYLSYGNNLEIGFQFQLDFFFLVCWAKYLHNINVAFAIDFNLRRQNKYNIYAIMSFIDIRKNIEAAKNNEGTFARFIKIFTSNNFNTM